MDVDILMIGKEKTTKEAIKINSLNHLRSFARPANILKPKPNVIANKMKGTSLVGSTVVKLLTKAGNSSQMPTLTELNVRNGIIRKQDRLSLQVKKVPTPAKCQEIIAPYRQEVDIDDTMIKSGQSSKTIDIPKEEVPYCAYIFPQRKAEPKQSVNLPLNVIAYINRLERENRELNKIVENFKNESNSLAQSLLKLSQVTNPIVFDRKKLQAQKQAEKEKQKPEQEVKFPINSIESLSAIEYGLSIPEFYQRVFKQLSTTIGIRVDLKEENLLFVVLSTMINLKIFGQMDYEDNNSSQASLKMFTQFRDLFGLLVNSYNSSKSCTKIYELKEIDNFLKIQVEEQKLILLSQKESDDESHKDFITIEDEEYSISSSEGD